MILADYMSHIFVFYFVSNEYIFPTFGTCFLRIFLIKQGNFQLFFLKKNNPHSSIFEPAILATFGKTWGKVRTISVRTFLAVSVFLFFGKIEIEENTDKTIGKVPTRLRKSTDRKMKIRTKNWENWRKTRTRKWSTRKNTDQI